MPLSTSQQSCHSVYLNLIVKFLAYLASGDNLCFSFDLCSCCFCLTQPRNPTFIKKPHSNHFTSLRSAFTIGYLSPFEDLSLILTRREPSPVLVGLATRLRLVWCCLEPRLLQPVADSSANRLNVACMGLYVSCKDIPFLLRGSVEVCNKKKWNWHPETTSMILVKIKHLH